MKLIIFINYFLLLFSIKYIVSITAKMIIQEKRSSISLVSEAIVDIIDNCFKLNYQFIIVYGDANHHVIDAIERSETTVKMMIRDEDIVENKIKHLHTRQPIFVITSISLTNLKHHIKNLRNIDLWNIQQPFFILNQSSNDTDSCQYTNDFLHLTWTYNLLHVYLFCYKNNSILVWSFNPFIPKSPYGWQLQRSSNSSWNLFYQRYYKFSSDNLSFCRSFQWDKTKQLNGFKVNAMGAYVESFLSIDKKYPGIDNWKGLDGKNMQICFKYLNITPILTYDSSGATGAVNSDGESTGLFKELATGRQDIMLNSALKRKVKNVTMTLRQYFTDIKFIVQRTKNMSTVQKIIRYLGYKLILVTIAVSIMTFSVLKYGTDQTVGAVYLEMIRLLSNTSILRPLTTIPIRLYFGPVLFFYLQFQAIFQGNLAALLTNSIPEDNLNTEGDLKSHLDYKLYIAEIQSIVLDKELKARASLLPDIACDKFVVNDSKAVCIGTADYLKKIAAVNHFHLSTGVLANFLVTSFTRKDWPIQRRFQTYLRITEESGLLNYWKRKEMNFSRTDEINLNEIINDRQSVAITLNDLLFAFQGLLCCLIIAIWIFLIESKDVVEKNVGNFFMSIKCYIIRNYWFKSNK